MKNPTTSRRFGLATRVGAGVALLALASCGTSWRTPESPAGMAADPQGACGAIAGGRSFGEGTIRSSALMPAGAGGPAYCEVQGALPGKTRFVVRMPAAPATWSGRILYTGGGGFNGNLAAANADLLSRGYATISSTGGNDVPNRANFALDAAALDDYADQSVHRVSMVARPIIRSFYGRTESRNYFEGCSNGGREGLISAQRWPQDFDGIIARAPAANFQNLFLGFTRTNKAAAVPGAGLSLAKTTALNKAVLAACDGLDGVADGIVALPQACRFDLNTMRCTGAETDACLTPPQLDVARTLYEPYALDGKPITAGYTFGSEATWNGTQTGERTAELPRYSNLFADQWVQYFVLRDPAATARQFDPSTPAAAARIAQLRRQTDSVNPDLSAFAARQGKLIIYHGVADAAISPHETVAYYRDVVRASGGQAAADRVARLYLNPGVGHCMGGPGADTVDLLTPLQDWVEKGIDPASRPITAAKLSQGATQLTRPLCVYPAYPRYKGSGDPSRADSFACVAPGP